MFTQDRDQLRRYYLHSWQKMQNNEPLEPLEKMVAEVVAQHPEYHTLLADEDKALGGEFLPETGDTNPFLHMGMHLAIQEQLGTDRPAGIREVYQQLLTRLGEPHAVDHQMMECLGEALWQAQRQQQAPDEQAYLRCLRNFLQA